MVKHGKTIYVPKVVIDEADNISQERKIPTRADSFKEMVRYSQVGREVERLSKFNFAGVGKPAYPPGFFEQLNGSKQKKWRQKTY